MNAVVVRGAQLVCDSRAPDPTPSESECLVRIRTALWTAAESATARALRGGGAPLAEGMSPGHASVGVLERVGRDAPEAMRTLVGARVAIHPVVSCRRCDRCLGGLSAHCRERTIAGVAGRSGGLAELVAIPWPNVVALPEALDDERAAFAVPTAAAIAATRHVRVAGKAYISVLGDSVEALVVAQVMSRLNAAVRVLAQRPATIGVAEKLGVKHRLAEEVGRRGDQDVVVDCVGSAESLAFASALVRARGTVLLIAGAPAATTIQPRSDASNGGASESGPDLSPIVANELRVQGSSYGSLVEGIDLLASRGIEVAGLLERRVPLADVPAIAESATSADPFGVLVRVMASSAR